MKKLLLTLVAFCAALAAAAQTPDTTAAEGYRFTDVKLIPMTPVKDQSRSGTCWCYSTLSFLKGKSCVREAPPCTSPKCGSSAIRSWKKP